MRVRLVLFIAILLSGIPGMAGFSIGTVSVVPPGGLEDLAPVSVTCEIPRDGITAYDQLVFTTDLDSPSWEPVVVAHNRETPVTPASLAGNRLVLNGAAAYNYPQVVKVTLRVSVKGTVPANHTANQTLLDIRQIDAEGTPYAFPFGNYTLPMPGQPAADVRKTPAPAVPAAGTVAAGNTAPPAPVTTIPSPVASFSAPDTSPTLPTPLPATMPKKAALPAGPLTVFGAAGIAVFLMRKTGGR